MKCSEFTKDPNIFEKSKLAKIATENGILVILTASEKRSSKLIHFVQLSIPLASPPKRNLILILKSNQGRKGRKINKFFLFVFIN